MDGGRGQALAPLFPLSRLDADEKDVYSTHTLGGQQELSIVNEPGLYALVLGSRKPEGTT